MTDSFTLVEAAPGVHAAIARSITGPAVSNATIIDLGDKTVVVDTFMTIPAAEALAEAARDLTGRAAYLVVTSHFHGDHVGGNSAFAGTPIAATRRTLELMRASTTADREAYGAEIDATLAAARDAVAGASTSAQAEAARGFLAMAEAMDAGRDRFTLTLPDLLIDATLVVEGSERSIEVVPAGPGHTESDVFVHIPDADVVIAGDLVWSEVHPKMDDGFVDDWQSAVLALGALEPSWVIPGHGAVSRSGAIDDMAAYLSDVSDLLAACRAGDLDPPEAEAPDVAGDWQGLERMRAGLGALASR